MCVRYVYVYVCVGGIVCVFLEVCFYKCGAIICYLRKVIFYFEVFVRVRVHVFLTCVSLCFCANVCACLICLSVCGVIVIILEFCV